MCEHKIADYTFVLYNVLFYNGKPNNSDKCSSLLCKRGSCICIDHEQTGLLRKLLSDEDTIVLPFVKGQPFSKNLQNTLHKEYLCQQTGLELYCNSFSPECEEYVNKMMEVYGVSSLCLLDVIKTLPVQYATNSLHKFEERDSLLYLCRYAPCSEKYLSILFRALICRTIGCCEKAKTREEKEAYVTELVAVLNRLKAILEQDDEQLRNQYQRGAIIFMENWQLLESDLCKSLTDTMLCELMDYLQNYSEYSNQNLEEGKHYHLYALLKKILETADISTTDFPDLPFRDYQDAADFECEYVKVQSILDQAKRDTDKLNEIWKTLFDIFWSEDEIPSEEIDHMLHSINNEF